MRSTISFFFLSSAARRFLLLLLSASFVLLLYPPPSSASGIAQVSENRVSFEVSDLLQVSPTTCSAPKETSPSKLQIVHRNGPCAPFHDDREPPSHHILDEDQLRVTSIQRRITVGTAGQNNLVSGSEAAVRLPARAGGSLGSGSYLVTVGFGTPRRDLTLIFDTGSDLSWIQCTPCTACYEQEEPLFDPTQSSTYANYSCGSQQCRSLNTHSCSANFVCRFTVDYGDGSQTIGNLSRDDLMLNSDAVPSFTFGCGDRNVGFVGRAAGLIGLGRGKVSLASQLSPRYGSVFSYCLTSTANTTGYLAIGREASTSSNAQYTPMLHSNRLPSFYFVNLMAIEVGKRSLGIQKTASTTSETVMDSGTVITRLPPATYAALRDAFREAMQQYKPTSSFSILDTCYDFSRTSTVAVPKVVLVFGGGARLDVDFRGILYVVSASQACLAFAPNSNAGDLAIIGNVQQRTYGVIYDIENSKIGFAPKSCS